MDIGRLKRIVFGEPRGIQEKTRKAWRVGIRGTNSLGAWERMGFLEGHLGDLVDFQGNPLQTQRGPAPQSQYPRDQNHRSSFIGLGVGVCCGLVFRVAFGFGGPAFAVVSLPLVVSPSVLV